MKYLFYLGILLLLLFEAANVYFIMPMPGSQRMESLDLAYFLYSWRWAFRAGAGVLILAGLTNAMRSRAWLAVLALAVAGVGVYGFNGKMAAEVIFYQPKHLQMADISSNAIDSTRWVLGVQAGGEARAYPIQLIAYHHQVIDTLAGKPIMVTYCSVCRSGRIFEPLVNGKPESFRLVGMDQFNAMFEDATTRSWWRQENGEAVTGKLKGQRLPELLCEQTSLKKWLQLHPNSLIMQPDPAFLKEYKGLETYDTGVKRGPLTRTDRRSWKDKSWVLGVIAGSSSKAFDWNRLRKERIIHDQVGDTPIVLVLASDNKSFFAFRRPDEQAQFTLRNDTLLLGSMRYDLAGRPVSGEGSPLEKVQAYQEFWHSWRTFHPETLRSLQ